MSEYFTSGYQQDMLAIGIASKKSRVPRQKSYLNRNPRSRPKLKMASGSRVVYIVDPPYYTAHVKLFDGFRPQSKSQREIINLQSVDFCGSAEARLESMHLHLLPEYGHAACFSTPEEISLYIEISINIARWTFGWQTGLWRTDS